MVTMDVQGPFDVVLKRKLLQLIRLQGWSLKALQPTNSPLTDKVIRVRLERAITGYKPVRCGIPQSSPWSLVLYMLYLAELLKQDIRLRFGYADVLCLYCALRSLDKNVKLLPEDVRRVLQSRDINKVSFALEKCEMMHITRKRDRGSPSVMVNENFSIQPVPKPERNK